MTTFTCYRYKLTKSDGKCSKSCHRYLKDIKANKLCYRRVRDTEFTVDISLDHPEVLQHVRDYLNLHFGIVEVKQEDKREVYSNKNEYFKRFIEEDILLHLSEEELAFTNGGHNV